MPIIFALCFSVVGYIPRLLPATQGGGAPYLAKLAYISADQGSGQVFAIDRNGYTTFVFIHGLARTTPNISHVAVNRPYHFHVAGPQDQCTTFLFMCPMICPVVNTVGRMPVIYQQLRVNS